MDPGSVIEREIFRCSACRFIDKPYCIYGPYRRFLPEDVRVLVVSESPPPGKKPDFIYNIQHFDRLRNVLARVFGVRQEEVPEFLKRNGIFWSTAVKCRPPSKSDIEKMRRNCTRILRFEIEVLKPKKIVALGVVAQKSLSEISPDIEIVKHYHPLYLARFRKRELPVLKKLILE